MGEKIKGPFIPNFSIGRDYDDDILKFRDEISYILNFTVSLKLLMLGELAI